MRAANRGDSRGVTRCGQPVVDRGADAASLDGLIARPMVAGDEKHDPVAGADCLVQSEVDRVPGAIEIHAVQVEHAVRGDGSGTQPPVPRAVERGRDVSGGGSDPLRRARSNTLAGRIRENRFFRLFSD
jgi:hypothetical protein